MAAEVNGSGGVYINCSSVSEQLWLLSIGGCRTQKEPGHGGLSTYETFILWLKFNSLSHFFYHGNKVYPGIALVCPGLQPPMLLRSMLVTGCVCTVAA